MTTKTNNKRRKGQHIRKIFRYIFAILASPKAVSEAINTATNTYELDEKISNIFKKHTQEDNICENQFVMAAQTESSVVISYAKNTERKEKH